MTTLTLRDLGFLGAITREPDPYFSNVTYLLRNGTGDGSGIPTNEDSASAKALTFTGATAPSTSVFKYGNSSFQFNGTGAITTDHSTDFDLGSQDFTIEAWVRPPEFNIYGGVGQALIHKYGSGSSSFLLFLYRSQVGARHYFMFFDWTPDNSTRHFWFADINSYYNTTTFQHYAITRQGSTLRMFANGNSLAGSGSSIGTQSIYSGTQSLNVGGLCVATPILGSDIPAFTGYLDDIRITTGICRYTTSFTPPTTELPDF